MDQQRVHVRTQRSVARESRWGPRINLHDSELVPHFSLVHILVLLATYSQPAVNNEGSREKGRDLKGAT
jgi:hypothetical protein